MLHATSETGHEVYSVFMTNKEKKDRLPRNKRQGDRGSKTHRKIDRKFRKRWSMLSDTVGFHGNFLKGGVDRCVYEVS